jgi:ATP-dependent 26S proteasome regulatory subunit
MSTPSGTVLEHNQEQAVERQVDRILATLSQKPDTGVAMLMQVYSQTAPAVQQRILYRLAMEHATSNTEYNRRLAEENERLKQPPHQIGVLDDLGLDPKGKRYAVVSTHEGLLEVAISESVAAEELVPGHHVALARNGAVVGVRGLPKAKPTCEFDRLLPDGRILARGPGDQSAVLRPAGELLDEETLARLRTGDLLEYEPATYQSVRVANQSNRIRDYKGETPDVSWQDIGGLEEVRSTVEEEVLGPIVYPEFYKPYGTRPPRGLLLEGPPGVGKTLLVKAIGRSLLQALDHHQDAPVLFTVKGTALQSSYVGEGPARVRALAKAAREAAQEYGAAIIMLDDFEYGGGLSRGVGDASSPAYSALSSAMIAEMDGIDDRSSRVLWAATANRADLLDSALLRPGRFGKKITVPRPGPEAAVQIFLVHLRGMPLAEGTTAQDLADRAVQSLFSTQDDNLLMRVHFADSGHEEIFPSRILSGAILAEAVRGASLRAIRRDRSNRCRRPGGIRFEDLQEALSEQLCSTVAEITAGNAHFHYLGLPEDRRVVAVERVDRDREATKRIFLE